MKIRKKQIILVSLLIIATNLLTLAFIAPKVYALAPTAAWTLLNNLCIQWKDSGGTARCGIYLDASNNLQLGGTGITTITLGSNLAGTYNIGGTPTLVTSIAISGDGSFNIGSSSQRLGTLYTETVHGGVGNLVLGAPTASSVIIQINSVSVASFGGTSLALYQPISLQSGVSLLAGGLWGVNAGGAIGLGNNQFVNIAGGCSCSTIISATEANVQLLLPVKIVAKNLNVAIVTAPGAGTSWTFTLNDNGVNTGLKCTISGATATSCTDTSDKVTVAAGDNIDIAVTSSGAPASSGNWKMSMEGQQSG